MLRLPLLQWVSEKVRVGAHARLAAVLLLLPLGGVAGHLHLADTQGGSVVPGFLLGEKERKIISQCMLTRLQKQHHANCIIGKQEVR